MNCTIHLVNVSVCGGPHRIVRTELGDELLGPNESPVGTPTAVVSPGTLALLQRIEALEVQAANMMAVNNWMTTVTSQMNMFGNYKNAELTWRGTIPACSDLGRTLSTCETPLAARTALGFPLLTLPAKSTGLLGILVLTDQVNAMSDALVSAGLAKY